MPSDFRYVTVRALKNFDLYERGRLYVVLLHPGNASLIVKQYFEMVEDPAWHESASTEPNFT